ncbi:MAG: DoxX family protein [Chitinophagales bacterium]
MISLFKIFGGTALAGLIITILVQVWQKENQQNLLIQFFRNMIGSLFIFSGFIKAIDPLGTSYKMGEYFTSFASDLPFMAGFFDMLHEWATPFAVFMIVVEIVCGICLILGVKSKITTWAIAAMMIFFTVLTGYTTMSGFVPNGTSFFSFGEWGEWREVNMRVTDCGCFGDFLKLKPQVSFGKDLVLLPIAILLLFGVKKIKPLLSKYVGYGIVGFSKVAFLLFCLSNFVWGLPMVDFRPYKIGNNIPSQRIAERDAVVEFLFVYRNIETGEEVKLTMDELTGFDYDTHEYVDRVEDVIDAGIPAKIANFNAYDEEGLDVSEEILSNPDFSFWVLTKKLSATDKDAWEDLNEINDFTETFNYEMFAFMASDFPTAEEFRHEVQAAYPFYQADETFIKTVIRANPGLVLLKDGYVYGKWHHNDIPSFQEMEEYIDNLSWEGSDE